MSTVDATLVTSVGVNVGYCAMARILPVLGCSTTTVQLSALFSFTCSAQACCASYCRVEMDRQLDVAAGYQRAHLG